MPYKESTMGNYNNNNPYVVLLRKKYDDLNELYTKYSKEYIFGVIFIGALWLLSITPFIFRLFQVLYTETLVHLIIQFAVLTTMVILYVLAGRIVLKYYVSGNSIIKEYMSVSEMQVNEITTLMNNEKLQYLLCRMNYLEGDLSRMVKIVRIIAMLIETCMLFFILRSILELIFH